MIDILMIVMIIDVLMRNYKKWWENDEDVMRMW